MKMTEKWRQPQKFPTPFQILFCPLPSSKKLPEIFFDDFSNREWNQASKPEIEFHIINIIYAALSLHTQTEKRHFHAKTTVHWWSTHVAGYSARDSEISLCHIPLLRSFFGMILFILKSSSIIELSSFWGLSSFWWLYSFFGCSSFPPLISRWLLTWLNILSEDASTILFWNLYWNLQTLLLRNGVPDVSWQNYKKDGNCRWGTWSIKVFRNAIC